MHTRFAHALQVAILSLTVASPVLSFAADKFVRVDVETPMSPPGWAVMERELLDANAEACRRYFAHYFDERGYLLCVERWGGDDGPDDAIENCNDWPILHALGAHEDVLTMYRKALEGHFRQFTEAKTVDVPFARDGMYYKEFPVKFDWLHNGEGLTVFNLQGLSDPTNLNFQHRTRRFAGFYMNEDPQAPNYDPEHKIIRSLFNGSRGPLLRKATGLDWAGDPIEVKGRFKPRHGEGTYEQMVEHFKDYNDIVGDHPSNLLATSLAMNAFMLTGEEKYRDWLLEYVDAWNQRMHENGGIIPTNIGLDGTIGGETDGKWYGGVYGWGFTVFDVAAGEMQDRTTFQSGIVGFMNAYVLSGGDDKYMDSWRRQFDIVNSNSKTIDGQTMYPSKYGDDGWYSYRPTPYAPGAPDMYYLTMDERDRKWFSGNGWYDYLEGKNPSFPEQMLQADFESIRQKHQMLLEDTTTPDTRLSDDPMPINPASVRSLIPLMLGGIHPGHRGAILNCRVRYFDPVERRAGIPDNVAALVEKLSADGMTLTLVNTNQVEAREVQLQAGGYGEHTFESVTIGGQAVPLDSRLLTVRLAPGSGTQLQFAMQRYSNDPTMVLPWDR